MRARPQIVLSGGMESMSNAPYLLAKARGGYRAGHDRIIDHMMMDGLEDAYETGRSMGDFGEATAEAYQFTRKDQDAYAMETLTRARKAVEGGAFRAEIAPITLTEKAGPRVIANDEHPLKVDPAKIPGLKPAFRANGTITPAASSANADGAAALILAKRSLADRDGLPVLAEIKGHATHSQEPQWFTTAPIPAIRKLLDKVGWSVSDVDLFEINEAFAVVAMAAQKDLGIPQRQTQRQWRRLRARPPDRRDRRATDRDAAACAGSAQPETRRRRACASAAVKPPPSPSSASSADRAIGKDMRAARSASLAALFSSGHLSGREDGRSQTPCRCTLDLFEGRRLDLPHALAGNGQLTSEILQARRILAEPPRLEHTPLPRGQHIKGRTKRFRLLRAFILFGDDRLGVRRMIDQHRLPLGRPVIADGRIQGKVARQTAAHLDHFANGDHELMRDGLGHLPREPCPVAAELASWRAASQRTASAARPSSRS